MSFAPIAIESTRSFIGDEFDQTAEPVNWNGYEVKDQRESLSQESLSTKKSILLSSLLLSEQISANECSQCQDSSKSLTANSLSVDSVLLSEKGSDVKGSVSVRGSADTDGNASARGSVGVSSRDRESGAKTSARAGVGVERDSSGNTKGSVDISLEHEF